MKTPLSIPHHLQTDTKILPRPIVQLPPHISHPLPFLTSLQPPVSSLSKLHRHPTQDPGTCPHHPKHLWLTSLQPELHPALLTARPGTPFLAEMSARRISWHCMYLSMA